MAKYRLLDLAQAATCTPMPGSEYAKEPGHPYGDPPIEVCLRHDDLIWGHTDLAVREPSRHCVGPALVQYLAPEHRYAC